MNRRDVIKGAAVTAGIALASHSANAHVTAGP